MDRLLRINDVNVDIDEKTAIGIDYQTYDVKEPAKAKVNVSNTFTVPATTKNLNLFGNPTDPQSTSTLIYEEAICNYWVENEKIIDNAKVQVQEIDERISLFIFEKQNFWESIKRTLWPDFVDELLVWLNSEKGLPIQSEPYTGSTSTFLSPYFDATEGVLLPYYIGNFGEYKSVGQKVIEYQTVDSAPSGFPRVVDVTVTSGLFDTQVVPVSYDPAITASQLAQRISDELNDNNVITEFYESSAENERTYLTSIIGISDASLNIAYSGNTIPDKPTSINEQFGVNGSVDFIEKTYDPSLGGVIAGQISLKQKTVDEDGIGGHFCVYARTLFEFIEFKYNVNLLTVGSVLIGNIWDDPVAQKLFVPIRELDILIATNNSYFRINRTSKFLPLKDQKDKADKTVYDLVLSFMHQMNVIKDELLIDGENVIRLARFDDIETVAEVVDFSDRFTGRAKYKPKIEGYAQNNYIKFKEVFPEGNELINSKNILCQNLNLEVKTDLIKIDAYVPSVIEANSEFISNAVDKESFKTFIWYISDEYTDLNVNVIYFDYTASPISALGLSRTMQIAKLYDLSSEYNFLDKIVDFPKFYEHKKWLTQEDLKNLEFFKQYYIRELNGSFFINKIKGFNPAKSKDPTTLELIKISNKTPITPPTANPWVDGVGDIWEDGEGDYWF
jgi:hypothetical protein